MPQPPGPHLITDIVEATHSSAVQFIMPDFSHSSSISSIKTKFNLSSLPSWPRITHLSLLHNVTYTPSLKHVLLRPPSHVFPRFYNSCKTAWPICSSQAHLHSALTEVIVDSNCLSDHTTLPPSLVTENSEKWLLHCFCNPHSPLETLGPEGV